jgi:hypothetical protein
MRNQILGYARPRHSARTGSKEGFVPEPRERRIKAQHSRTASEPERPRMMSQSGGHSCSLHVGRNARVGMAAKKEGLPTGRPASESTTAKQPSLSFRIWAEPSYQRTPTSPTTYLDTTKTDQSRLWPPQYRVSFQRLHRTSPAIHCEWLPDGPIRGSECPGPGGVWRESSAP